MNKDMGWSYMSKAKVIKYLDSYSVRGVLVQCWAELFELFDYSNSYDRIVVFGIHIRSISWLRILIELLFE